MHATQKGIFLPQWLRPIQNENLCANQALLCAEWLRRLQIQNHPMLQAK